ncbi:NTP transferase domain-containing protein [Deinococcus arenicola]|uniref:NTP transferase domain-containing protein n=1 Tax=Deinococcus arenicola TaxID=2994950 RepID=A0ABU4DMX0_9DEIO|nr:NTP transferase domain-containing protein [Deinococcus sp. ZS9-10]MDV6373779.1 NTP transferase domain-containing protein [Deinococcus sp. ZS9-10]
MTPNESVRYSAVVLGGGDPGDAFAAAHGVTVKPLIPLNGQPMTLYVLHALRDSGRVARIAYVGPTTPEIDALIDTRVTDHGSLLGNLEAGVEALEAGGIRQGERVLVVTADIPMLVADEVRDVLDSASTEAALVYPVVRREVCEAAYPGVKRTYARLKDGSFTGGNLFILDPALIGQFLPRLREVLDARKAPLKLAGLIGPGIFFKLLTGRLTVEALEAKVSSILGVQARALITPHAAVGTDVDKDEDLTLAGAYLKQTGKS